MDYPKGSSLWRGALTAAVWLSVVTPATWSAEELGSPGRAAKAVKLPPFIVNERPLPVELPPFVVTESTLTKPWRYAAADGFEVLAQCDDAAAQQIFNGLWRGPRLTLPPQLRPHNATPMAVVIFDQKPAPGGASEKTSFVHGHFTHEIKRTLQDREVFSMNLYDYDFQRASTFRFDLRTLLALHTPTAPQWLQEALHGEFGIYDHVYNGDGEELVELNHNEWISSAEANQAKAQRGLAQRRFQTGAGERPLELRGVSPLVTMLPPLTELWREGFAGAPSDHRRWSATAALFARWAMVAEGGKHHEAFWRFAIGACSWPVTEDFFRECFGLDFDAARNELAWYLPIALTESAVWRIRPLHSPVLEFRPATRAEIARVRGEFERSEALTLATRFPDIAVKYSEQLDRTLKNAGAADSNDPGLIALSGLHEFESGNNARARTLLEAATAGGEARPRAWLALAFLRFAGASDSPAGTDGRLDDAQAAAIMAPLTHAFSLQPAMTESYELLADVWRLAPRLPASEIVARLAEGQRAFPRNVRLALAASRACFEHGQRDEAIAFIDRSLPLAADPSARDQLGKAREALVAAPAAEAR